MSRSVKITGFAELDRKLSKLASTFNRRKNGEIERTGAEVVLAEMQALAPVRTGALKESLAIVDGDKSVMVGPVRGGAGSRAHFIEFGTVNMAAQPFIRPAFDNTQGEVKATITSTLLDEIGKAAR